MSFAFILAIVQVPNGSNAQRDEGLRLSPAILDISGNRATSTSTVVTLHNGSLEAIAVTSSTRSLTPEDDLIDESEADRYGAEDWINLLAKDFLIAPDESIEVDLSVDVPESAAPGGHYALVTFKVINTKPQGSGVQVSPEAAVVVLINVPGDIKEFVDIEAEQAKSVTLGGTVEFTQTLMNRGNSHVTPIVTTDFINAKGEVIDRITQPVQLLLPNTKRKITVKWDTAGNSGKVTAVTLVSYGTPTKTAEHSYGVLRVLPGSIVLTTTFLVTVIVLNRLQRRLGSKNNKLAETKAKPDKIESRASSQKVMKPLQQKSNKNKTKNTK